MRVCCLKTFASEPYHSADGKIPTNTQVIHREIYNFTSLYQDSYGWQTNVIFLQNNKLFDEPFLFGTCSLNAQTQNRVERVAPSIKWNYITV